MSDLQKALWFAGVVLTGWLIYLLAPVLTPFLVAALIAYLGDPLVLRLERWKLSRTQAVSVVFLVLLLMLLLMLLLIVPLLERQVMAFVARIPRDLEWLQTNALPWLEQRFGIEAGLLDLSALKQAVMEHWQQAGGIAANLVKSLTQSGLALLGWLANLVLIPVVAFYLMRDWPALSASLQELLPRRIAPTVLQLWRESDQVLGAFLRGQLSVMLALAAVYATGLWLAGVEMSLMLGLIAGLVSFVPYLGFIVGVVMSGFAALMQTHELFSLVPVLIVFGVGQLLEGFLLTPWLVGDRIGLHPVAVIFAVLAGGQLFGFVGVLIGLPVAAVLAVLLRHANARYRGSRLYDDSPPTGVA